MSLMPFTHYPAGRGFIQGFVEGHAMTLGSAPMWGVTYPWSDLDVLVGDIVILLYVNGNGTITTQSGFTSLFNDDGNAPSLALMYRVVDGTESGNISSQFEIMTGIVAVFGGHDSPTGGQIASTTDGRRNGDPDPPSLSGIASDSIVLAVGGLDDDNSTAVSAPSGYTMIAANQSAASPGASAQLAYKTSPSSTEDPAAFNVLSGDDDWVALTVELPKSV